MFLVGCLCALLGACVPRCVFVFLVGCLRLLLVLLFWFTLRDGACVPCWMFALLTACGCSLLGVCACCRFCFRLTLREGACVPC